MVETRQPTRRDRRRTAVATAKAKRAHRECELARAAAARAEEIAEEQAPLQQRIPVVAKFPPDWIEQVRARAEPVYPTAAQRRYVTQYATWLMTGARGLPPTAASVEQQEPGWAAATRATIATMVPQDGSVVREALVEPDSKRGGYRRADPLRRMHAQNSSLVTRHHMRAADRFSRDYEVGVLGGTKPGGDMKARVDCDSPPDMAEARLLAIGRYRSACDAMGPSLRIPVQQLVLHRWSLARIAWALGVAESSISGYLVAALDRLCDHYEPERNTRGTVAAAHELIVDPAVNDIPQEQIGRFVRAAKKAA